MISTVLKTITIIWKINTEGTLFSIIAKTNDRLTCYAKKVCINLTNSVYACLIFLSLYFINRLHMKSYFF